MASIERFLVVEEKLALGVQSALLEVFPFFLQVGVVGNKFFHDLPFCRGQFAVQVQQKELFIIIACDHGV
jgi:hypothetical protein